MDLPISRTSHQSRISFKCYAALGSPFAANQWLRFAKAQHAYQAQLFQEKQQLENAKLAAIGALLEAYKPPIDKAWDQFQQDVNRLRETCYDNDIRIWCAKMTDAIQKKDFALFSYLKVHSPYQWLEGQLHYPDLNMPGLPPAEIADLSKFYQTGSTLSVKQ